MTKLQTIYMYVETVLIAILAIFLRIFGVSTQTTFNYFLRDINKKEEEARLRRKAHFEKTGRYED